MREIKFRGQTRKLGEKVNLKGEPVPSNWVYGGIFQGVERSVIYDGETYEKHTVYNETVGQYTGLKDKNGREIYEGDVVEYCDFDSLRTGGHTSDNIIIGEVIFDCGTYMIQEGNGQLHDLYVSLVNDEEFEIIGNIHENPELLGDSN